MSEHVPKKQAPVASSFIKAGEMSKRDFFAAMVLQGLLARGKDQESITANVQLAVWYADELQRELEGLLDHREYDPLNPET